MDNDTQPSGIPAPVSHQGASDFGKVVSPAGKDHNVRVSDIGEIYFSRQHPTGQDPAGLQQFRVLGWFKRSAISVDGQPKQVRFKGFGFADGKQGSINDKPVAIYQECTLLRPNPFARIYRIDLEREEKGLENFNGFPLITINEAKRPFHPFDRSSYTALSQPYLYENESMHDSNFHTIWRKVRPSNPKETLPRNPDVLQERIERALFLGSDSRMAFYHASSVKGVDLNMVQGLRDPHGNKFPRDAVLFPGRVDTANITKLSTYCSWVQNGDPNPVSVYKKYNFKLAPIEGHDRTVEFNS